jgi:META domain-containing protein
MMGSVKGIWKRAGVALLLVALAAIANPARADDGFPFGFELTLDVEHQPGSKRVPLLDIGDNGEATFDLWCKDAKGQFSVAGNTVIFVPGPVEDHACPAAQAEADDQLVTALSEATSWKREGDFISFIGTRSLRFQLNTN